MTKHNPGNERIKRRYFTYLKEARRHEEPTIDAAAKALSRWEEYTKYRDFGAFHSEQAVAFKRHLAQQTALRSGKRFSKATLHAALTNLKRFFQWLAMQPGFKTKVHYCDAEYFNLSENETRIATAKRSPKWPTLEQIKHVIHAMPTSTDIELRNRALVAFTILTGARDRAIASMKLKHVDLVEGCVNQDGREVRTKFGKTFRTYFFPVSEDITQIVAEWVKHLREDRLWGNDDPLFPSTRIALGETRQFEPSGLDKSHWSNASPIRMIFRQAFDRAGLAYFNPHSLRSTLVHLGQTTCQTPEHFKAWSQNLGHEKVLTTFMNYGEVECFRQGEIIRGLQTAPAVGIAGMDDLAEAVIRKLRCAMSFGNEPPTRQTAYLK